MATSQGEMSSGSDLNHKNVSESSTEIQKNEEDIIPGFKTIQDITKPGFGALIEATRASNSLPTGHDWDLYTSYPSFLRVLDGEGNRLLETIHMILQHQGIPGNIMKRPIDEKLDLISDANDAILERVGMHLDELDGIRRKPEPLLIEATGHTTKVVSGSWNKQAPRSTAAHEPNTVRLLTAKNIERPQAKFKDAVDNSNTPFEPRIKDKPNALKPLAILVEETVMGEECFSHPYDYELDRFTPSSSQLAKVEARKYKALEETPLVMISTPDQLPGLVEDLERHTEIAVDLEHHSYRSFLGITCLMQISTRDTDYIVDTLALRDSIHCLNQVFTKPSIVKVLHGAMHDIEWLQRDLCLYIVNMFDTQHAAKHLNVAPLSLAYLLSKYCNVNVNKRFQLADWRIRPLPEELLNYARGDTHYLLYVHDVMKNELIDAALGQDNLLSSVYQRGVDLCKRRYMKPILREESYMDLYQKSRKMFDNRQLFALREIYNWRDATGRQEDESTGYVLPGHMLLHICETLPREMQGILACCNPIPPLVRQNLVLIHQIILKARDQPLVKMIEENRPSDGRQLSWTAKVNVESSLHCPHDLTKLAEFRDDLPTLLDELAEAERGDKRKRKKTSHVDALLKEAPEVTLFENESMFSTMLPGAVSDERLKQIKFVSPYERCKLVQPFIQAEEEAEELKAKSDVPPPDADQERIDRIKEHFVQESKRLQESSRSDEPLRNQKTGKRKRDISEEILVKKERPVKSEQAGDLAVAERVAPKPEILEPVPSKASRKKLKAQRQQQLQQTPQETPFKAFDYSQVDFNRFKGGSEQANQQKEAKSKNKNKNKKKFAGKSNNKSCTFGKGRH